MRTRRPERRAFTSRMAEAITLEGARGGSPEHKALTRRLVAPPLVEPPLELLIPWAFTEVEAEAAA